MTVNNTNGAAIEYRLACPPVAVFIQLRADCGWGRINQAQAQLALRNSIHVVCAFDGDAVIGFGRVIGDGALNFYIQDLIVDPNFHHQNVGSTILAMLMAQIKQHKIPGRCTVGLMAAVGKEPFYEKFGFINRPTPIFGGGMTANID